MPTIAVIFDFDDTLVPDSTTLLLAKHGIDPGKFWQHDVAALVADGYDSSLAWLRAFLDNVGPDKPLGTLTNESLTKFGATLDGQLYPGLPALFDDLKSMVAEFQDVSLEFYVISGGLEAVIQGCGIVGKYFRHAYGCVLAEDGSPTAVRHIKRAVNFTEKTRYLFEINKGLSAEQTRKNPYLVNKDVPKLKRRVPFQNMIYVGDGLTDIPCFSMLKAYGGTCFGVFDPSDGSKAKRAYLEFLKTSRVVSVHSPKYGKSDDLGALLRAVVSTLCTRFVVEQGTANADEGGD